MALISRERFEELRTGRTEELARLKQQGRKVVGYFDVYTPVEVICACGAVPVRLNRGGFEAETLGERCLRSDACAFCLSSAGNFKLDPIYQLVDAVVAVNTCDMLRRLPETLNDCFGLPVYQVYMPRTSEPLPHRVAEFRRHIVWLADELSILSGQRFDVGAAEVEARKLNLVRARLRALDRDRLADKPSLLETDILNLVALAGLLDADAFVRLLADVEARLVDGRPRAESRARLALAGSEVTELDRWLIELLESRADIVTDLLDTGTFWFADDVASHDIELPGDILGNLARFLYQRGPGMMRRPNVQAYTATRRRLQEFRVQGLVYKTLLYCDPWGFEAVRLRDAIRVPMLHVDGNYSEENREQLRTRVEAFLEGL